MSFIMKKKNKIIYICFAASPLHLICIKELVIKLNIENFIIFHIYSNKNDLLYLQMCESIKFLNLKKNVEQIKILNFSLLKLIQFHIFANFDLKNLKFSNKIFVFFDFRNSLMHYLRLKFQSSKFILIDDGFQTYISYKEYINQNCFLPIKQYFGLSGIIKKFLLFKFQFQKLKNKKFEIFTIYGNELRLQKPFHNKLSFLNSIFKTSDLNYSKENIYFSGTKLSERNVISLNKELDIMKKINSYWKKKNKKLIYIAKRSTSQKKIQLLKQNLIDVFIFNLPIELALLKDKKNDIPWGICSFGSTTNKTLSNIYPNIKSFLFVIKNFSEDKDLNNDMRYSYLLAKHDKKTKIIQL